MSCFASIPVLLAVVMTFAGATPSAFAQAAPPASPAPQSLPTRFTAQDFARLSPYAKVFAQHSGGHYFGEDESDEVKGMSPEALRAWFGSHPDQWQRVRAKGQVAQLRKWLGDADALTSQQAELLEGALIAERDRHERDLRAQYAHRHVVASGSTWTGMVMLASDDLGISVLAQSVAQAEDFGRQQIAAAALVLSARQLEAYRRIQAARMAQYRSSFEHLHRAVLE